MSGSTSPMRPLSSINTRPASRSSPWLALWVACIGYAMVIVDTTAVNVALPSIGSGLSAASSSLQWVTDSYVLVFASLLVAGGALADWLGTTKIFVAGTALFAVASAACALAPNLVFLTGARAIQGAGAAALAPSAMAIVTLAFPNSAQRAKALGIFVTAAGSPQAVGPVLGGALVGLGGWRLVFWINIPLALVTVALARRVAAVRIR